MTDAFKSALMTGAEKLNISFTPEQVDKFFDFYQSVVEYNKNVNLTSITDETEFAIKHIIDSVSAADLIDENAVLADVGAGAGFPSIPLKILRPDIKIVMFDSLNKRVTFLCKAISELSLTDISAVHARAEDVGHLTEYRARFDYAVTRAVGATPVLLEYALPLLRVGGTYINYKGADISDTENIGRVLNKLKGGFSGIKSFSLPYDLGDRNLVLYKKLSSTPDEYPRSSAKIVKFPL